MFCFNKNMGIELLTNKPIKFYQKNGVKFFERFRAVDKNRKPVELFMDEQNGCPTIFAKNHEGKHSTFELDFNLQSRTMRGKAIIANPKQQELGQVVNLAALMTFYVNKLNHFKIFAFRESMQFFAKFGFKVVTDNDDESIDLSALNHDKSLFSIQEQIEEILEIADALPDEDLAVPAEAHRKRLFPNQDVPSVHWKWHRTHIHGRN